MMKLMASVLPLVSHCDVMKLMDELKARRALVTVLPRRSRLTWVLASEQVDVGPGVGAG